MFTLLPPDEKKLLSIEYKRRFAVVLLLLTCVGLIIGGILFMPSYLLSKVQAHDLALKKTAMANSALSSEQGTLLGTIKGAQAEVAIAKVSGHFPSQIFLKIQTYQPAGITLTHFSYAYATTGSTLTLTGVAANRQTLIDFNNALKKDPMFANADFPLSNLSDSKDISFTMNISGSF